jgi:trans-2,3-dihydro-3-hydroxyanthranilate isomerase
VTPKPGYAFVTADVFTDQRFAGNPLAVFPDARGLTAEQMGMIAREFNLSETTFVLPPERPEHTRRVRIFTPGKELPFAGHPTIGTAIALAAGGHIQCTDGETRIVFEEGVGPVPVTIRSTAGIHSFAQLSVARLPEVVGRPPSAAALAEILSLGLSDILQGPDAIQVVSAGVPYLYVPLVDRQAVARARPRLDLWPTTLAAAGTQEIYIFSHDPVDPKADIHARMFAPSLGVPEDPATGSAVAALGGYLASRDARQSGTLFWHIEQGVFMRRPSHLFLEVDKQDGRTTAVRVGGSAVMVSEGLFRV